MRTTCQCKLLRLLGRLVGVVAAFGLSASCGTDERAGRKPDIAEERDAGADAVSVQEASADSEDDHSRTDSMTADASNCDDTPSISPDAGDPPPDCIPPCIWRVLRNCLPKGPCGRENGWREECAPVVSGGRCSYFVEDVKCFGFTWAVPGAGSRTTFVTWDNGESQLAWGTEHDGDQVNIKVHCCAGNVGCDAGSEIYDVHGDADRCPPWQRLLW
jgi:hypothetical protein